LGFAVVVDMRGSTWSTVKPILKVLQEHCNSLIHVAYIIKPDNFWQKQRTSLASHKYKFEVIMPTSGRQLQMYLCHLFIKPL
jgi:kalirin